METEVRTGSLRQSRFRRIRFHLPWLIVYLGTVATLVWWYEFRPGRAALSRMQGTWQFVKGGFPDEQREDAFMEVRGPETWIVYPPGSAREPGERAIHRSRVEIRPADNFFVVRRSFGFDYGHRNPRETEYVVCLKECKLCLVHGLATLDSVTEKSITELRSIDDLPADAKRAIDNYLKRRSDEEK